MSIDQIGPLANVLIRNEVATQNEFRGVIGWAPSKDPKADMLRNPNMPETPEAPDESKQDPNANEQPLDPSLTGDTTDGTN